MKKKIISLCLIVAFLISGCASVTGSAAVKLPLVPALSEQEVIDYYKEQLDFDTIASRNVEVDEITYETREVTGEKRDELIELVGTIEDIVSAGEYEDSKLVSKSTFHYIKSMLNDMELTNGNVVDVQEALGHYFVDIEYEVVAGEVGSFKPAVSLLGLHGAFKQDLNGNDSVNDEYLKQAVAKVNKYYRDNGIDKSVTYNSGSMELKIEGGQSVDNSLDDIDTLDDEIETDEIDESEDVQEMPSRTNRDRREPEEGELELPDDNEDDEDELQDNADDLEDDLDEPEEIEETAEEVEDVEQESEEEVVGPEPVKVVRRKIDNEMTINTTEFNKIAGSPTFQSSYMPRLDLVYNKPASGGLSGIGILATGKGGLSYFGYDRGTASGKMTLRYVFKEDVVNNEIKGIDVYTVSYQSVSGVGTDIESVEVPSFLMEEFEKIVERSDRAIVNVDLPALMSGRIYEGVGVAVLTGYHSQYSNVLRNISTVRRVVARDIENNAYLVEIETIRQEGKRDVDSYGVYRDKYFLVIEQWGNEFIITDRMWTFRSMTKQPPINPDRSIDKRLVALNLAGPVSDESKEDIKVLLQQLYDAGTARLLNGPKEIELRGQTVELERGMYDCFNSDPTMLSTDKKEYMNSTLRNILVAKGVDVKAEYSGTVTEWIGGADNQAELITEEVVAYAGTDKGMYMQVYYLVSNMQDEWVIDDMKIIEREEKEGAELQQILDRLE